MKRTMGIAALVAAACIAPAQAQDKWPSKPITYVVPFAAGGSTDILARIIAQKLSVALGQTVIVENKPGAGGNIGADAVAKSTPDGYTLLMGAVATHAINPTLYASMPYDAVRDFQPVTQLASTPNVLIVNPSIPAANVREFIAHAKANPGKLNFGSGSTGSAGHLAGELFKAMAGVEMTHVPYKGAAPAMQDLIAGRVQLMFDNFASASAQVKAGKVRALAVTTAKRSALAPELPTIAETGLAGFDINTWFGLFVPAGTPREIVERLHGEFTRALALADIREKLVALGAEPVGSRPEEFATYIRAEADKYARVIKASGARAD